MKSCLIVIGASSFILREFIPAKRYDRIYLAGRTNTASKYLGHWLHYDLEDVTSNERLLSEIDSNYFDIDIVFSSYFGCGLKWTDTLQSSSQGISANLLMPLDLFSRLSQEYTDSDIRGVFVSSMYAHVSPKASNYKNETEVNPLYYGVAKAGVEQGLRWLSCRNKKHAFNAIALGPIPKPEARNRDPQLMEMLLDQLPSKEFIRHEEVSSTINYLLSDLSRSIRGSSISLDGGYTLW